MAESVTLYLPEDMLERYRHSAAVSGKHLDEFLVDRLAEAVPPVADDLPNFLADELKALEKLDDQELWQVAKCVTPDQKQDEYDRLLAKQSKDALSTDERQRLNELGDEARRLTVKKAHAFMLLKWRGHSLPPRENLRTYE